jgi:hypothetical protein
MRIQTMKRLSAFVVTAVTLSAAVQGCSKEAPLYVGGPPGAEARQALSTSSTAMKIGESAAIGARAEDAVGNVTGAAVAFASCNSSIATVTSGAADAEWTSTGSINGVGMGTTCVTASSGGITDTVEVAVGPAGLVIVGPDTVLSGALGEYSITAVDGAGTAITGTVPLTWTSSNSAQLVVGAPTGEARGRSPGSPNVRVFAPGGANASKKVVVITGVFAGVLSATSGTPGGLITATKAADGEVFDGDTQVKVGGVTAFVDTYTSGGLTFAIPGTGSTAAQTLGFTNLGAGQVAQNTSFTPTLAATDKYQPGNVDNACNVPATIPDFATVKSPANAVYIVHDGRVESSSCIDGGGAANDHWFTFTTGGSGVIDLVATWQVAGDYDLVICDTADKVANNGASCAYGYSGGSAHQNDETMTNVALAPNTKYWFAFEEYDGTLGINNVKIVLTKK